MFLNSNTYRYSTGWNTLHHEPSVVVLYMQPATAQVVWEGKVTWCSCLVHVQMTCSYESYLAGPEYMKPFVYTQMDIVATNAKDVYKLLVCISD